MRVSLLIIGLAPLLVACQGSGGEPGNGPTEAFDGIAKSETIFLTGTEPFWGGQIENGEALYSTPEMPEGTPFPVDRFAGNNGLAFTGRIDGKGFDLTVTPGECSDTMSDRAYPFVATLKIGDEQRNGCAWTDSTPFTGPANP